MGLIAVHGSGCRMPKCQKPYRSIRVLYALLFYKDPTKIFNSKFTVWQVRELCNPQYSGGQTYTKCKQKWCGFSVKIVGIIWRNLSCPIIFECVLHPRSFVFSFCWFFFIMVQIFLLNSEICILSLVFHFQ